jgi:hypothetical protein
MKKILWSLLLAASAFLPAVSHADLSTTYSNCQRACSLNGLTCVLRCLASGGGASKATEPTQAAPAAANNPSLVIWSNQNLITIWGDKNNSTASENQSAPQKPAYSQESSIRSKARNFAPRKPYNSDQ